MNDSESPAGGAGGPHRTSDDPIVEESIRRPRGSFGRRNRGKLAFLLLLLVPAVGFALWAVIGLSYTYSSGERAGHLQKISRKGWICKTWEGTLYTNMARGFSADSFTFTVRDDSLARVLQGLSGKRVAVQYDQHNLVPTRCFGDTEYFVSGVREVPE